VEKLDAVVIGAGVVGLAVAGGILFVAVSAALKSPEVGEVFGAFRRRRAP